MNPTVTVERLPKTGARDDFSVRVAGPVGTDYRFRLSITYTVLGIWQAPDNEEAATALAEALMQSHGIAFPEVGFWFDSYNSADTANETCNIIRRLGWRAFLHPSAQRSLGDALFNALEDLDAVCSANHGRPFLKSLDVLFERDRALEDLETEAVDHPHLIYRICILSGIIDRFDFDHGSGSLNGLRTWLGSKMGDDAAAELTMTYQMVKRLRKQYPIHENFAINTAGERQRRSEIVKAEEYFGLSDNPANNWHRVFTRFIHDTKGLAQAIAIASPTGVTRQRGITHR